MPAKNKVYTIYPDPRVTAIIGIRVSEIHAALDCWAILLARATVDNAGEFTKQEWAALAEALSRTRPSPELANPGDFLALILKDADAVEGIAAKHKVDIASLGKKLAKLDYVHAWAVITAVEWYKDNKDRVSPSDPWWTLDFKRRTVDGELMKPAKKGA
jgi:hypothetical protein